MSLPRSVCIIRVTFGGCDVV